MIMTASEFFKRLGATAKSMVKVILLSRATHLPRSQGGSMVILANGPSLADTINQSTDSLMSMPRLAVNFAANAPQFTSLRPDYYLMVDPLFFSGTDTPNLAQLKQSLAAVDWPMTLIVPADAKKRLDRTIIANPNISLATINYIGASGFHWLENMLYSSGRAMPRPRNVLVPAIMAAMAMGYDTIYLTGADHSWMQTIWVDDDNHVISVQPHFYKDHPDEQKRVDTTYRGLRLHQVVESFAIAFKSYHSIARYARHRGTTILNATPHSFIDAFERAPLPQPDITNQQHITKNHARNQ